MSSSEERDNGDQEFPGRAPKASLYFDFRELVQSRIAAAKVLGYLGHHQRKRILALGPGSTGQAIIPYNIPICINRGQMIIQSLIHPQK